MALNRWGRMFFDLYISDVEIESMEIPQKVEARSDFDAAAATLGVGDAVGVPRSHWFVAIVKNNTEKSVAEKLTDEGVSFYLPTQEELRIWRNGRRKKIERVVIPATIFIHCTEPERREIVKLPYINRFMTNKAGSNPNRVGSPLAIIPDSQIQTLRFMLGNAEGEVTVSAVYSKGDKVKVVRGGLRGLEGEIIESNGKSELMVRIDIFGCARVTINPADVIKIRN